MKQRPDLHESKNMRTLARTVIRPFTQRNALLRCVLLGWLCSVNLAVFPALAGTAPMAMSPQEPGEAAREAQHDPATDDARSSRPDGTMGAKPFSPIPAATTNEAAFLAVRDAARNGSIARLTQAVAALPGDDLMHPWAEYWLLQRQLAADDDNGIADFLQRYTGSFLANKLRGAWLMYLGGKADWARYRAEYPLLNQPDTAQACYAAQASDTPQMVRALLQLDAELPAACHPLALQLLATGELSTEDVWQRVRRLLATGKVGPGKTAASYLPAEQGFERGSVEAVAVDPARYLARQAAKIDAQASSALPAQLQPTPPRRERELTLFALHTLARKDVMAAAAYLHRLSDSLSLADTQYVWGRLARAAAGQHLPEALPWYDLAADAPLDEDQVTWHVRAALRAADWTRVQRVIAAMPATLAQRPEWIYWQARAFDALGQKEKARALFSKIAGQAHFYGQLAVEDLGWTIRLPLEAAPPTAAENIVIESKPELQRALTLFRLGMHTEGVSEWNWAMTGLSDRLLLAAARLAARNGVWDRAIFSADRTQNTHNFSLRYLAPYVDHILPEANAQGLDGAWVYGLMRQESRFVIQANSSVGAQGLMQIMPATAQWVAKKINLTGYRPQQITDIKTNVLLGVSYLRLVSESLDNSPVLASAAYNAGPARARRWRDTRPLEGAIYIETIPFSETRDYVKKVMSNTMYYHLLFHNTDRSLKAHLGVIQPVGASVAFARDLP
jgi:soluble lytic murein transglycosylase